MGIGVGIGLFYFRLLSNRTAAAITAMMTAADMTAYVVVFKALVGGFTAGLINGVGVTTADAPEPTAT